MKKIFLLILIIISTISCKSQIGTAVGTAFKNLFTGNGFRDATSDQIYEEMKTAKQNRDKFDPLKSGDTSSACLIPTKDSMVPVKGTGYFSAIKDQLCSCKSWGTCDNQSCSCDVLCPNGFDIFNRGQSLPVDSPENSLSFTNTDSDFYSDYKDYSGFCWGHALTTQRFNRLATFDHKSPKKFIGEGEERNRISEYKYLIKKLNNNEPVDIPGFKNLAEFSSDPEVEDLLEDTVKKNWAENAMSSQGLSMVSSATPQGADYYNKLFDDLDFRLANHQQPAIVFNDRENPSKAHTVLVNGSGTNSDGKRYICLRDNNFTPAKSLNCQNKMLLNSNGTITYDKWFPKEIGKIKLSFSENSNSLEQMNNLKSKCLQDKKCNGAQFEY